MLADGTEVRHKKHHAIHSLPSNSILYKKKKAIIKNKPGVYRHETHDVYLWAHNIIPNQISQTYTYLKNNSVKA